MDCSTAYLLQVLKWIIDNIVMCLIKRALPPRGIFIVAGHGHTDMALALVDDNGASACEKTHPTLKKSHR